jgi:hypothetical protein
MVAFIANPVATHQAKAKQYDIQRREWGSTASSFIPCRMYPQSFEISNMAANTITASPSFDAIAPDPVIIFGFGTTFVLCVIAGWVWANQVVPVSRTNLAISKRTGAVREYLDILAESGKESKTDISSLGMSSSSSEDGSTDDKSMIRDRTFERWLFTDWLQRSTAKGGRQKEPALPILTKAKWNSGDNPVLVATALIMIGVIFSSVTERVFSL